MNAACMISALANDQHGQTSSNAYLRLTCYSCKNDMSNNREARPSLNHLDQRGTLVPQVYEKKVHIKKSKMQWNNAM